MANEKILVVDDDKNICELLRLYLVKEGFAVTLAYDGKTALQEFDKLHPDMVLLDADLSSANGTGAVHRRFPERTFNVGIAEQNLVCVAAGLASYGFKPYITSFTPFATRRVCDQLAISVLYADLNVKVIGTDPGIAAELNGGTHMSMEDIGREFSGRDHSTIVYSLKTMERDMKNDQHLRETVDDIIKNVKA